MTRTAKRPFTRSSGNVFEDLQVPAPSEALAKSEFAAIIAEALRSRRLTQTAAAQLLGIDQPKVSELLRGRLTRFSTERLLVFLLRLVFRVDEIRQPLDKTVRRKTAIQFRAVQQLGEMQQVRQPPFSVRVNEQPSSNVFALQPFAAHRHEA